MKKYLFGMLAVVLIMSSCINTKKMIVLENMDESVLYPVDSLQEIKIQRDDRISVLVSSKNPELALPFNMAGEAVQMNANGEMQVLGYATRGVQQLGYLVNPEGYIEFPILGRLHVMGLTRKEVSELIKGRLISDGYISDPIVYVELQNLRVTVMGEVRNPGVQSVTNARITLLEAITRASGLTSNADLKKVSVIREENNERKLYMLDIRSTDIFESPCFYLQQNDVVYIYPKFPHSTTKEDRTLKFYSLGIGLISFLASMFVLLK